MPALLQKHDILNGQAQVVTYKRSPDVWYYREKIEGEKAYRSKKIEGASNKAEAEQASLEIYAHMRANPVLPRVERIKEEETVSPDPLPPTVASDGNRGANGGAYYRSDKSKPKRTYDYINRKRKGMPVSDAIDDYLVIQTNRVEAGDIKANTLKDYVQVLCVHLKGFFNEQGIKNTSQIEKKTFEGYALYRKQTTKLTRNKEATIIKAFVDNYLAENNLIASEVKFAKNLIPKTKIKQQDLDANPAINPKDWEVINKWIRFIYLKAGEKHPRPSVHYWRYLFWTFTLVMKNTGARPNEILNLRWNDVEIEDVGRISKSKLREEIEELESEGIEVISDYDEDANPNGWAWNPFQLGREERLIAHMYIKESKTGNPREVPANIGHVFKRFMEYQKNYLKKRERITAKITPNTLIFGNPENDFMPYMYHTFNTTWWKMMNAIGNELRGHKFSSKPYTIYSMRSTYIEDNLLKGTDIFLLSRTTGHSVDMLKRHYERLDVRERAEELTNIDYGKKKKQIKRVSLFD